MNDSPPYNNFDDTLQFEERNVFLAILQVRELPVLTPNNLKTGENQHGQVQVQQESNEWSTSLLEDINENQGIFKATQLDQILYRLSVKQNLNCQNSIHNSRVKKEVRFVTNEITTALLAILKRKIIKYYKAHSTLNSEPLLSFFVNVCNVPPSILLSNGGHELKIYHNLYFGNEIPLRLRLGKCLIHTDFQNKYKEENLIRLMHQSYVGRHILLPEFNKLLRQFITTEKSEQAEQYFKLYRELIGSLLFQSAFP